MRGRSQIWDSGGRRETAGKRARKVGGKEAIVRTSTERGEEKQKENEGRDRRKEKGREKS
jgi:hypothetical protein